VSASKHDLNSCSASVLIPQGVSVEIFNSKGVVSVAFKNLVSGDCR